MAAERVGDQFVSAIGHPGAADFLTRLLGKNVPVARLLVTLEPGDAALVLRSSTRFPEGAILSEQDMVDIDFELGWIERLA
ncbi:MAG: STIV orfB116 family protein [Gammaproteobacteria bacterium]